MRHFSTILPPSKPAVTKSLNKQFFDDVVKGLTATPKHLDSKYFYDSRGDELFQQIMNCPEYYPTSCEMEIFCEETAELAAAIIAGGEPFELIELGAGDATKSSCLLKYLLNSDVDFTYLPIDISDHVISYLNVTLPVSMPRLRIHGLHGEYFEMLKKASGLSSNRKVVLFLGSNIGNMPVKQAEEFCKELRAHLSPGDLALIGVDLKKDPQIILNAYNDEGCITREFNLNLLARINRELGADFDLSKFHHYPTYDPETGACKSYLISTADQQVSLPQYGEIAFCKDEYIFMEVSQKYNLSEVEHMATLAGFDIANHFFDSKKWFTDSIWVAV